MNSLLMQRDSEEISACLFGLLNSPFVDIKCDALEAIAKRHLPGAREIVFNHLDWDASREAFTLMMGGSNTSVINALAEFDDVDAHRQILTIWKREPDMFTSYFSKEALFRVHARGNLGKEVIKDLFNYFL